MCFEITFVTLWSKQKTNLITFPKFFFVPDIIEKRKPLADTARRAGWVGCNIDIGSIPESGKIFIIRNSKQEDKSKVIDQYQHVLSLQKTDIQCRGWLLDVLKCVERIPKNDFTTQEMYAFVDELQKKHPDNNHVQDKIRQQLQFLRDKGFVKFTSRGHYKKII